MNVRDLLNLKHAVRERDRFRCLDCGLTQEQNIQRHGTGLEVHRLIPGSPYTVEGCETLCKRCHGFKPRSPRRETPRQDVALVARARHQAIRLGLSLSAYIRLAVVMKLEQDEATEPDSEEE